MFKNILGNMFKKQSENKKNYPLVYSVGAYMDKNEVIILNPLAKHEVGYSSSNSKFLLVEPPYTLEEITDKLEETFAICEKEPKWTEGMGENFWEAATGIKSYTTFCKNRIYLGVSKHVDEGYYRFSAHKKYRSSGYLATKNDPDFTVPILSTKSMIGEIFLKAFSFCK